MISIPGKRQKNPVKHTGRTDNPEPAESRRRRYGGRMPEKFADRPYYRPS